jgi:hypothetical protein
MLCVPAPMQSSALGQAYFELESSKPTPGRLVLADEVTADVLHRHIVAQGGDR